MKKIDLSGFSRKKTCLIVLSIALLQLAFLIFQFCLIKTGYSGDEVYSYATADSSQAINPVMDTDGTLHFNEWLTSEQLFQAVTVSKTEVFDYGHINEILRDDAHPPLYFYLLHFFCTFFSGRFSWLPSVIINSVSIFIGQVFFYRLFLLLSNDRFRSVIAMVFFGFTTSVINMMTFARNYTLLTALTMVFTFYIFRSVRQYASDRNNIKSVALAAIFLYLAAMTQYLSVLYGFFVTFSVCVYYLSKKDIKNLLRTGLFMTGSIALMILSFREVIHQLGADQTSMESATEYPYLLELRVSFHILVNEIFGLKPSVYPTMTSFWIIWGIIGVSVIMLIMSFLFRTDKWFINIKNKTRDLLRSVPSKLKNLRSFQYFSLLLSIILFVLITSYRFKMFFYYPNSNRYLFIIYPYVAIIFLIPLFIILKKHILQIAAVIVLCCMSLLFGRKTNVGSSEMKMKEATALFAGSDVLVFVPGYPFVNNSVLYLRDSDKVFYTTIDSFPENKDSFISGLSDDKTLYMLYCWPSFDNGNSNEDMLSMLRILKSSGMITADESEQYFGAEPIAGIGGHVLFRLQ